MGTAQQARAGANKKIKHDWHRTGRMLVVGLSLGLPQHCWYTWLDRILPGVSMLKVTKKIFLDQLILAPVVLCSFFMVSGLLERHSLQQSWKEVQNKFAMVYKVEESEIDAVEAIMGVQYQINRDMIFI